MGLVTIAEVKDYMKLDPTSTSEDAMLGHLIAAATAELELAHNRKVEYKANAVEKYNGKGEDQLFLKRFPIYSVSSVKVDGVTLDPSAYEIDAPCGILVGAWNEGVQNIEVTYTAGYWTDMQTQPPAGVEVIPFDLKHECLERVAYLYERRGGRR